MLRPDLTPDHRTSRGPWSRVAALALAASVAAACGGTSAPDAGSDPGPESRASVTSVAATTLSTTTTVAPPPPYELPADEVEPELKRSAVRFVETLLTYDGFQDPVGDAARRLEAAGMDASVVPAVAELLVAEARSDAMVVYPQLGGLEADGASVMVVVDHQLEPAGCCSTRFSRTLDVRLAPAGDGWTVIGVESIGGQPPGESRVVDSQLAQQVLASDALGMPDSARWDIEAGLIADEVLRLLIDILEAGHSMQVTSFVSGHPVNVFGRPFLSNHSRGLAVDVWAVDGQRVTGSAPGSGAYRVVERALAFGATEVGSPWDLDGPGGSSFTNALHADHLHLAFDP